MRPLGGIFGVTVLCAAALASPPRRPSSADYHRYYELRLPRWFRPLRLPGEPRQIDLRYLLRFPNDPRLSSRGLPKANETWQAIAVEKHLGIRLVPILGTHGLDFRSENGRYVFEMLTAPVPTWPLPNGVVEDEDFLRWRDVTLERHLKKVALDSRAVLVLDVEGLTGAQTEETIDILRRRLGRGRFLAYDGDGVPIETCVVALRAMAATLN